MTEQVTAAQTGPIPESTPRDGAGGDEQSEEAGDGGQGGWLSGWGMSGLTSVVKGTTNVMKKTVQETSSVVQQTTGAVSKTVEYTICFVYGWDLVHHDKG